MNRSGNKSVTVLLTAERPRVTEGIVSLSRHHVVVPEYSAPEVCALENSSCSTSGSIVPAVRRRRGRYVAIVGLSSVGRNSVSGGNAERRRGAVLRCLCGFLG